MSGLATGTRLRVAELARQPLTLLALLALPPAVVETYGTAVASFPRLPTAADPATAGRITGALFAVAFLAGLLGLFQVISARSGDERAAVAGLRRERLLAARLLAVAAVVAAGTTVTSLVLAARVGVAAPLLAAGTLALAGLVYGLLGVLVGTLVPRELEGSVVLVFLADLDNALSSGLFPLATSVRVPVLGAVGVADLVPLYHPHELFATAVLEGTLADGHLVPAVGWLVGLLVVSFLAYGRAIGDARLGVSGGRVP